MVLVFGAAMMIRPARPLLGPAVTGLMNLTLPCPAFPRLFAVFTYAVRRREPPGFELFLLLSHEHRLLSNIISAHGEQPKCGLEPIHARNLELCALRFPVFQRRWQGTKRGLAETRSQ